MGLASPGSALVLGCAPFKVPSPPFDPVFAARRFGVSYVAVLVALSALIAVATSLPYLLGPGGAQALFSSLLRSAAPMATGSALCVALVLWAEAQTPSGLALELDRHLKRALAVSLGGYLLAALVALGVTFGVAAALALSSRADLSLVTRRDLALGSVFALLDSTLILLLARRFAARLRGSPLSLPAKLILVVTVTVPLRATLALLGASLLPG